MTLAFRRWGLLDDGVTPALPARGRRYTYRTGSVLRVGQVIEIIRPVRLTIREMLDDPPCRVLLTMRWRLEPVASCSVVRLNAQYRLNRAAVLRPRHWDRRLQQHFGNQVRFLQHRVAEALSAPQVDADRRETVDTRRSPSRASSCTPVYPGAARTDGAPVTAPEHRRARGRNRNRDYGNETG